MHVLAGAGTLTTEAGEHDLTPEGAGVAAAPVAASVHRRPRSGQAMPPPGGLADDHDVGAVLGGEAGQLDAGVSTAGEGPRQSEAVEDLCGRGVSVGGGECGDGVTPTVATADIEAVAVSSLTWMTCRVACRRHATPTA